MKALRPVLLLAGLLVDLPASAAQEFIVISDSLAANADTLTVKEGSQRWGRISKWRIGDYTVVSSKLKSTRITAKSNLFKTKTVRHSTTQFTFVLGNTTTNFATVNAVRHVMDLSSHEMKLSKSVSLGSEELVQASDSCNAVITVNGDTTETWTLLKSSTSAPERGYEAFLTNGERTILLTPVRSKIHGDDGRHRSFFAGLNPRFIPPAMGYEFIEGGQAICALQTFGGAARGNARMVWMHRGLDARVKLILAAAITTVLQVESSATGLEPPKEDEE